MRYAVELPAIRDAHQAITRQTRSSSTIATMSALIVKAQHLEMIMSESNFPDDWRPHTVNYVSEVPEDVNTAEAWIGPVHRYTDIDVASALNKLRSCRIMLAKLIITGVTWAYPDDYHLRSEYRHAVYVEQKTIDDICSSVPSHFGFSKEFRPLASGDVEMQHTADLIAGYLLHWPLRVSRNSPRISERQRAWIDNKLEEVASRCGVHQASILSSRNV